jgi:hypothetical protein
VASNAQKEVRMGNRHWLTRLMVGNVSRVELINEVRERQ